jgi:hypothetical protein
MVVLRMAVRSLAALVMAPSVVRIRCTGARGWCALRFWLRPLRILRGENNHRSRCEQCDSQKLFHLRSPQEKFPCVPRAYTKDRKCLEILRRVCRVA